MVSARRFDRSRGGGGKSSESLLPLSYDDSSLSSLPFFYKMKQYAISNAMNFFSDINVNKPACRSSISIVSDCLSWPLGSLLPSPFSVLLVFLVFLVLLMHPPQLNKNKIQFLNYFFFDHSY